MFQVGHTHDISEVKWSPDDRLLVSYSAGDGRGVRVWDVREGRLLWSADESFVRRKDEYHRLTSFDWSPDSGLLAAISANGMLLVWDVRTGRLRWVRDAHADKASVVVFSRDGRLLATAASPQTGEGEIKLWDAGDGRPVAQLGGRLGLVRGLAFSADGATLKAGESSGAVSEWEVATGRQLWGRSDQPCGELRKNARSVLFSTDLRLMAARCWEKTVITETATGRVSHILEMSVDFTQSMSFSGDGRLFAAGDSGVFKTLDLKSGETGEMNEYRGGFTIAFNGDGSLFVEGGGWGEAVVKITEVKSGRTHRMLEGHPAIIRALAFSPDGNTVVSASDDRVVRRWDARTGTLLAVYEGHESPVYALAYSPDGSRLVTAGRDLTLRSWETHSGALRRTVETKDEGLWGINSVAFSPDGRWLVTAGENDSLRLRDAETLEIARSFRDPRAETSYEDACCESKALSVVFSPDGRLVLSGHEDGTVRIWDAQRGVPVRRFKTSKREAVAAFGRDGLSVVVASGDEGPLTVWDARTGRRRRAFGDEDAYYVHALAVSPDARRMVTSDVVGDVTVWDLPRGTALWKLDGGFSGDDAVVYSPDGRRIAAGGKNQNILMWDASSESLLWSLLPIKTDEDPLARGNAPTFFELKEERERKTREADRETGRWRGKVRITFEHDGELVDHMQTRMAETGEPDKSLRRSVDAEAEGVWLRLRNDSPLPIAIPTHSMYLAALTGKCHVALAGGRKQGALCDGMEVGLRYVFVDARGDRHAYGIDSYFVSILPPGASVLFNAPRAHLAARRPIFVEYTYQKEGEKRSLENYGTPRRASFKRR